MLQVELAEGVTRHRIEALMSDYAAVIRPARDWSPQRALFLAPRGHLRRPGGRTAIIADLAEPTPLKSSIPLREYSMPNLQAPLRCGRTVAVMLLAALAAGCVRPLAVQHEFFSPVSGSTARITEQTQHTVSYHRALQAAQRTCASPASASIAPGNPDHLPNGPDFGPATAREALADLCATPARPPVAAHGGLSNAYQRWVEDRVRELPDPSQTAVGAAGGS